MSGKDVIFCIFVLFIKFMLLKADDQGTLELSHVIYRHGDRTPINIYPNDPYNETYWPDGLGQLTKLGKYMEYNLGRWLRNRYGKFISQQFNSKEVYVRSTDVDRTLMSAQCVLASLFYPDEHSRFNESIVWMPTPVHTVSILNDKLLTIKNCPRVGKEKEVMRNLPEIKSYIKKLKPLFNYLSEYSGDSINNLTSCMYLYDTLKIERIHNLTLPDWANGHMEELKKITDFGFKIDTFTTELKRLLSGPLIGEIRDHMDAKMKNSDDLVDKKLYMYSAHDSTVATLLNGLGIYNDISPPYAATVLIELYQREGSYFVKMFYKNESLPNSEAHLFTLPGCNSACPLHSWKHLVEPVVSENWDYECNLPNHEQDRFYIHFLSGTVLLMIIVLIVTAVFFFRFKNKYGRGTETYQPIPSHE